MTADSTDERPMPPFRGQVSRRSRPSATAESPGLIVPDAKPFATSGLQDAGRDRRLVPMVKAPCSKA
jgi:hypothetical protein